MTSTPPHTHDTRLRQKQERLGRQARDLREVGAIGMDLTRLTRIRTYTLEIYPGALGEICLSFARVSRTVRQTFALENRVEDEIDALDHPAADNPPEPPGQSNAAPEQAQPAPRVEAINGDAATMRASREAREDLLGDLDDALEDDLDKIDGRQSVGETPIRDAIERIRRDLRLESAAFEAAALPDAGTMLRNGAASVALDGGFPVIMPLATRTPLLPPSRPDTTGRPPPDG